MTMRGQRIDRRLPDLFVELANASTPDYLEAAIEEASSRPQRPAWTFPGRWLPVQITTQATPVARMPWRQLGILALIGILLAAAAVAYVGSRRTISPAPLYGLAENGVIAISKAGDIHTVDHATGAVRPLITGPETDRRPEFFRDGTKIAFQRRAANDVGWTIMVANADGTGIVPAIPSPIDGLVGWSMSPAGDAILVTSLESGRVQSAVHSIDGARPPTTIDALLSSDPAPDELPTWRPPDGREILVVSHTPDLTSRGVHVVDAATGQRVRTLVDPSTDAGVWTAGWSTDGAHVSYGLTTWGPNFPLIRTRIVGADGGGDRPLDVGAGINYDPVNSDWSNDRSRIVVVHQDATDGTAERVLVLPTTGSESRPVELRCNLSGPGACHPGTNIGNIIWRWSPDDRVLLGSLIDEQRNELTFLASPDTGLITPTDWNATDPVTWQRLAP